MKDYNELIAELRSEAEKTWEYDRDAWTSDEYEKAADAIEQLVTERNAAVAEIHWLIVSWFTTGKINVCKICCNYNDENHNNECKNCHTLCPYSNFSWRGVQE